MLRRLVPQHAHGIDVAQQDLVRAHHLARLGDRNQEVEIDDLAAKASDPLQDAARVPAVEPHAGAERVQAVHHLLLVGPDEFIVEARTNERRGGVADADQLGARQDLAQPHSSGGF